MKKILISLCFSVLLIPRGAMAIGLADSEGYQEWILDLNPTLAECVDEILYALTPDVEVGEYCYCKKIEEESGTVYKWCQLDGDGCGTSTSCD